MASRFAGLITASSKQPKPRLAQAIAGARARAWSWRSLAGPSIHLPHALPHLLAPCHSHLSRRGLSGSLSSAALLTPSVEPSLHDRRQGRGGLRGRLDRQRTMALAAPRGVVLGVASHPGRHHLRPCTGLPLNPLQWWGKMSAGAIDRSRSRHEDKEPVSTRAMTWREETTSRRPQGLWTITFERILADVKTELVELKAESLRAGAPPPARPTGRPSL